MPELANWEPSFKNYNEFSQVMNGLVKMFGDCSGCLKGGGDPNCKARSCVKQKDYRTCAKCNESETCEPLALYRKSYKGLAPVLQNVKHNGIEKCAEEMQKKVNDGYNYT